MGPISEPTLILIPIELEIEPPILKCHIPLMGKEYEFQFFDLKPFLEPKLTLEPKLNLSHIFESVLILKSFIFETKSTISSNHILLLDYGIDQNDSEMIFKDWSNNRDDFNVRILHDPIQFGDNKNVNRKDVIKDGFLETPHYLDWAVMLGPI